MKRKLLLPLLILTLSSCSFSFDLNDLIIKQPNNELTYEFIPTANNSKIYDGYYQPNELRYNFQTLNSQLGWVTSLSVDTQKLLVVPVKLKNEPSWTSSMIEDMNDVFFGNSSQVNYYSVKDYFYQSSYGKLNIEGEVLSTPFNSSYTVNSLKNENDAAEVIANEYQKVLSENPNLCKKYDLNEDGFIDNIIFIYSSNYDIYDTSVLWAWCSYTSLTPDKDIPQINNYMWASYHFSQDMYDDNFNYDKLDTHTYIHEVGHLLGLDDYYSYDDEPWDCAGYSEMQSYNVGDHNAYSKMALGWINPYVVTSSCSITLKTSALYPQAILINDKWNGSAFDEYILIEYYTPKGVNLLDSQHAFEKSKMYNYSGLRIYHIDARLVKMNYTSYDYHFESYSDYINNEARAFYYVGASNSVTYSFLDSPENKTNKYVHLLDEGENNRLNYGNGGTLYSNSVLWTGEKTFTPSSKFFKKNNTFNDGSKIGYEISVSDFTDESCKVTIKKN